MSHRQPNTHISEPVIDLGIEADRVNANFRLARMRERHPELGRAEAQARIDLAAAIIAMDEVEEKIANDPTRHSLQEQAAVNQALAAYGQALADLLRGEVAS